MCAPFSTFRAFVSSFECTSLRFHSITAKVGGMKRRTRRKKDSPGGHFCVTEKYSCLSNLYMLVVYLAESSCVLEDPQRRYRGGNMNLWK